MAIFSNLEGTMKRTFTLGKKGVTLQSEFVSGTLDSLSIKDATGTNLVPISAASPLSDSHVVTLAYFKANSGGGGAGHLRGKTNPTPEQGSDGDVYYKINDTIILEIFIKDDGIWKPYLSTPVQDSAYATTNPINPEDFVLGSGQYAYTLPASVHSRGADVITQLQGSDGDIQGSSVVVDGEGDITVRVLNEPTSVINVVIVGGTNMSSPYSRTFNKADWVAQDTKFVITVPQSQHGQVPGALYLAAYDNEVDSATSTPPYALVSLDTSIDSSGNVTFISNVAFSGKLVISGK